MSNKNGGEIGIRTLGGVAPTMVFKTIAFDHSAISPYVAKNIFLAKKVYCVFSIGFNRFFYFFLLSVFCGKNI